jgi:hypothetical protein
MNTPLSPSEPAVRTAGLTKTYGPASAPAHTLRSVTGSATPTSL